MSLLVEILLLLVIVLYTFALCFIFLYSITQAHLLLRYLFHKKKYEAKQQPGTVFTTLPSVTIQLPVYNERYVASRLIDCVVRMNYPKDKLEIQVLDDSTDDTFGIIAEKIE